MTTAEIINRINSRLKGVEYASVYEATVEFVWKKKFYRARWDWTIRHVNVVSIDPKYTYQIGKQTLESKVIEEKLNK